MNNDMMILTEASNYIKKFKCPYCEKRMARKDLIHHVDRVHEDMIPEGFTASRVVFNTINHKDHGSCVICGKETAWDENKCKYDRMCGSPKCHEEYLKRVNENMIKTHGTTNLLTDPRFAAQQQTKMLANRRISGVYHYGDQDKTYTGSFEKAALEFMDTILHCKAEDILMPGPIIEYEYDGATHLYISDIYYVPYNLLIEVKDGGDNPNTRNMPVYRAKQLAKEKAIINSKKYNYLRLTNNNFAQLLSIFAELKFRMIDDPTNSDPIIRVNEAMSLATIGSFIPPEDINDIYIVNYGKKNMFGNFDNMAVSMDFELESCITINEDGELIKLPENFFKLNEHRVYKTSNCLKGYKNILKEYLYNKDGYHDASYLYETLTGKTLYSINQLETTLESITTPLDKAKQLSKIVESTFANQDTIYWEAVEESGDFDIGVYIEKDGYFYMNKNTKVRSKAYDTYEELYENVTDLNILKEDIYYGL